MHARNQMFPLLEHSIDRIYSTYPNIPVDEFPKTVKQGHRHTSLALVKQNVKILEKSQKL